MLKHLDKTRPIRSNNAWPPSRPYRIHTNPGHVQPPIAAVGRKPGNPRDAIANPLRLPARDKVEVRSKSVRHASPNGARHVPRSSSAALHARERRAKGGHPRTLGTPAILSGWRSPIPRTAVGAIASSSSRVGPAIIAFLQRKWARELDIASSRSSGGLARTGWRCASHMIGATIPAMVPQNGDENWEFDAEGLMPRRSRASTICRSPRRTASSAASRRPP